MTDQLKAQVVRGVMWSTVQIWGMRLVTFAVYPVLARLLGPETYGLIALAGVYVMVLDIFSDVSFGAAVEQRQDLDPLHIDSIFWAFLALGAMLTALSIAGAPLVAAFFKEPELTSVVRWLSLGFLLQMVSGVQTSLLRRELRMKALASRSLLSSVVGGIVGITMALGGFGVWSVVGQRLTTRVLSVMLVWQMSRWRPRRRFSWSHLQDVARFGLSVMGNRVLSYLNRQLDQLLIGRYLGRESLGFYFNASRLYGLINGMLVGTFSQVALPAMAQLQHDLPRFRHAYTKACRFVCLVAFPIFVGLALMADEFIVVVLGDQWQPSVPALRWLALVGVAHAIQYVNGAAMMALGRAELRLVTQIVHSLANTVGFFLAVRHGFVAVAAVYTIRAWVLMPLDLLVSRHIGALSLRSVAASVWPQTASTMVMAAAVWWLRTGLLADLSSVWRLVLAVIAGAVVYVGTVVLLDRGFCREIADLLRAGSGRPNHSKETSE